MNEFLRSPSLLALYDEPKSLSLMKHYLLYQTKNKYVFQVISIFTIVDRFSQIKN